MFFLQLQPQVSCWIAVIEPHNPISVIQHKMLEYGLILDSIVFFYKKIHEIFGE